LIVWLTVKGCKIYAYAGRSGPLSRDGFLSCNTCCDMGSRFFLFPPKDRPIQSPFTTHMRMWRIYSYPDTYGSPLSRLLRRTNECGGIILTRIFTGLRKYKSTCTFADLGCEKMQFFIYCHRIG
jgi:hypothetical protein